MLIQQYFSNIDISCNRRIAWLEVLIFIVWISNLSLNWFYNSTYFIFTEFKYQQMKLILKLFSKYVEMVKTININFIAVIFVFVPNYFICEKNSNDCLIINNDSYIHLNLLRLTVNEKKLIHLRKSFLKLCRCEPIVISWSWHNNRMICECNHSKSISCIVVWKYNTS